MLTPSPAAAQGLFGWGRRLIDMAARQPEVFDLPQTQAVAHIELLETLLATLGLTTATAQEPQPPANWARPAEISCTCQHCRRLNEILAAPHEATGRIHAREDMRSHLITMISRHQCDVTHKLEKTGSPYALVFTKTAGSYQRRLQRFRTDQRLLETVNGLLDD